jgi:type IV pilus assembly protein PilW
MYRLHPRGVRGFSLVELLVAMVIGLIGSIIIFQVYAGFEGQRRNTTSGGDAVTNLAAATNALEQAGRDAGYGLNFASHMGCSAIGWKEDAKPPTPPATPTPGAIFATRLAPVDITRNADNTLDTLTFTRNTNDNSYSVTSLKSSMDPATPPASTAATANTPLCLNNMYGVKKGDVLVIAEHKESDTGTKAKKITCAITEVRDIIPGPPVCIDHTFGSFVSDDPLDPGTQYTLFNKPGTPGGLGAIPDTGPSNTALNSLDSKLDSQARNAPALFTFKAGAAVMNLGPKKNGLNSIQTTTFKVSNGQLLASDVPLVDGIVFMDAQFGMASSPTTTSSTLTYTKMLPEVAGNDPKISQDTWFSLRTVRVVMITKSSQYDKDYTSPATLSVWNAPLDVTYTVPVADIHYRHKVVEMVIPLRNMFWRPR